MQSDSTTGARWRTRIGLKKHIGPNLENYLRDYRPVHAECIKIALSITQGLDYIHGQNISHRNLIPSNVVIDPISCHATLYGFDIATRLNGTIDYKADYYSLGVLLYELITGKPAFQIEDPLHSIYNEIVAIPASPSSVNSEVPIELSNVVMKLLEKIPEKPVSKHLRNSTGS
jgi:serine/threonine protein kinase